MSKQVFGNETKIVFGNENKVYEAEGELRIKPSEKIGNGFKRLTKSCYEVTLSFDGEEAQKLVKTFSLIFRRQEKRRMYELVFKYNHVKEVLLLNLEIPEIGRYKFAVSNNTKEMVLIDDIIYITVDEQNALLDWIKVLNGYSPLCNLSDMN